jgi:hypothetical protein
MKIPRNAVSPEVLAEALGLKTPKTLLNWSGRKKGPKRSKVGSHPVYYLEDIRAWNNEIMNRIEELSHRDSQGEG